MFYAIQKEISYPKEELKGFRNFEQKQMFCSSNGGGGCDWSMRTLLLLTITFLWWCPIFRLRRLGRTYKQFVCSLYYFCLFHFSLLFICYKYMITTFVLFGNSLQFLNTESHDACIFLVSVSQTQREIIIWYQRLIR